MLSQQAVSITITGGELFRWNCVVEQSRGILTSMPGLAGRPSSLHQQNSQCRLEEAHWQACALTWGKGTSVHFSQGASSSCSDPVGYSDTAPGNVGLSCLFLLRCQPCISKSRKKYSTRSFQPMISSRHFKVGEWEEKYFSRERTQEGVTLCYLYKNNKE